MATNTTRASSLGQFPVSAFAILCCAHTFAAPPPEFEFFEKRIRPLLAERCYECHGETKQKGGLRLDSAAAVLKGGDSGPALVPGEPEESRMIKGVSWSDPDFQMPPKNKLAVSEIAALTEWIKMGAPDPRTNSTLVAGVAAADKSFHWAYQPPKKVAAPTVKNSAWAYTDIDRFILAKLEAKNLQPAPDADRATLIRRAYYDLIGLPPTPEQIDEFVNDRLPQAFARAVDRLLASPQFGERWGRHWLDVARFGESVTLRGFIFKEAWRYRDFVIEAFNSDMPFDQFIREQIAGDLLPSSSIAERRRRMIATTFLALGNTNLEEQDKAQLRMDIVDEQLDTIGKAILAQTIGCARCHDHKFDPIPTRDYYAMAGILRSTKTVTNANVSGWIEVPLPVEPEQEEILRKHEAQIAVVQTEIKDAKEAAKALAGKSGEPTSSRQPIKPTVVAANELPGVVVDSSQAKVVGAWKHSQFSKHYIGDGYLHDDASAKGERTLTFLPDLKKAGRYEVRFAYTHSPSRATNVPVTVFHADGETTVHVNEQEAPVLDGRFVSLGQFRFEANGFGYALVANEGTKGHVTADAVQFLPAEAPEVAAAISNPVAGDVRRLTSSRETPDAAPKLKALEERLKKLQETGPKRPMVMSVKEEQEIGDTQIHIRGSVHNLGATVPRGFLQVASFNGTPRISENQSGRREFADWLTSPSNPLTARVIVNRVWHWLFGAGLVRTTDNFGTMGEAPSHPELLDHLALRFVEDGWSMKKLVREMMLSHAYQISSEVVGRGVLTAPPGDGTSQHGALGQRALPSDVDPENRLLWRFNRRRLDAECIRDTMLFVSGQLKLDMGGPTINPAASADYGYSFTEPRRSVYVPALRNALPEILEAFDFADPNMVTGARNVSTVAPQALLLMNHPFVREQARLAAERLALEEFADDSTRLHRAYRLILGRAATAGEISVARKLLRNERNATEAWTELLHALFASADFRYLN